MGEIFQGIEDKFTGKSLQRAFTVPSPPSVKLPSPPPPPALPQPSSEKAKKRIAQKRRGGFAETFLTGDLTPDIVGKKTRLA